MKVDDVNSMLGLCPLFTRYSPFPALGWTHVDLFPVFIFISGAELVVMVVVVVV